MPKSSPFTSGEVRYIAHLIGPDYLWESGRAHGGGDPILGAGGALDEVRGMLRPILRAVRRRKSSGLRLAMESMGYRGRRQDVSPMVPTGWRATALSIWPGGCPLDSSVELSWAGHRKALVLAVLRSLGRMLEELPHLNRATLDGRLWQRQTAEVMLHVEPGRDQIESLVLAPSGMDDRTLAAALVGEQRRMIARRRHILAPVADQLLGAWLRAGFLVSPAGIMVTDLGAVGVESGWSAIVPGNGIPLAVSIGQIKDGRVRIGTTIDHRALDGSHAGEVQAWLRRDLACGP